MANFDQNSNFMNTNYSGANSMFQSNITNSTRKSVRAAISFNNQELSYFETLFATVSTDGMTATGGKIVPLFRKSGVKNELLKEIWLKSATQSDH